MFIHFNEPQSCLYRKFGTSRINYSWIYVCDDCGQFSYPGSAIGSCCQCCWGIASWLLLAFRQCFDMYRLQRHCAVSSPWPRRPFHHLPRKFPTVRQIEMDNKWCECMWTLWTASCFFFGQGQGWFLHCLHVPVALWEAIMYDDNLIYIYTVYIILYLYINIVQYNNNIIW